VAYNHPDPVHNPPTAEELDGHRAGLPLTTRCTGAAGNVGF
jgi:hypothetical protein